MKHLKIPYQNDALRFGWDIPVLSINLKFHQSKLEEAMFSHSVYGRESTIKRPYRESP